MDERQDLKLLLWDSRITALLMAPKSFPLSWAMLSASMKTPETEPKLGNVQPSWKPAQRGNVTCLRPNSSRVGTKIQVFRLLCSLTLSWAGKVWGIALLR